MSGSLVGSHVGCLVRNHVKVSLVGCKKVSFVEAIEAAVGAAVGAEGVVRLGTSLLQCTLASMRLASVATHKT